MTEAQSRTIPVLLDKKDALVKSQTGSGKTLAYAIPIVQVVTLFYKYLVSEIFTAKVLYTETPIYHT